MERWIDWNLVLDKRGGPNHLGNYCGAPIMIDVLAQLSRTIRPGDRAVQASLPSSPSPPTRCRPCGFNYESNTMLIR